MAGSPVSAESSLPLPGPAAAQLDACVHCGFCLPVCPTYKELGEEADSPRGRIDMIGGAFRGEIGATDPDLALHLDRCLDCRACESACPSGVRYHELYEAAVAALPARRAWTASTEGGEAFAAASRAIRFGLGQLVSRPWLLALAVRLAGPLARLLGGLPPAVRALLPGLPQPVQRPARQVLPAVLPATGPRTGEVELFLGCIQDACFGADNVAAAHVLASCGQDVRCTRAQGCCGAIHLHTGDRAGLVTLARRNIAALGGVGEIVTAAAGCGAVLKEYGTLFADEPFAAEAAAFSARVRGLAEFVGQAPVRRLRSAAPAVVTWHDPCHLCHAQGIRVAPRALLQAIDGLQYVELPEADACCGSAGVYNLLQPELAGRVLDRKLANIAATGAGIVVTENPGCALQLRAGLARAGLPVRVLSLAQVLAEAAGADPL